MSPTTRLTALLAILLFTGVVVAGCGGGGGDASPGFLGDQKALERSLRGTLERGASSDVAFSNVTCTKGETRTYQCSADVAGTSDDAPLAVTLTVAEDGNSYTGRTAGGAAVSGRR